MAACFTQFEHSNFLSIDISQGNVATCLRYLVGYLIMILLQIYY